MGARGSRETGEGEHAAHGRQYADFLPTRTRVRRTIALCARNVGAAAPTTITQALSYQLDECCKDGEIQAMVVADGDGLPLAAAGDTYACDEVAARMVLVGPRISEFDGTLLGDGHALGRPDDEGRGSTAASCSCARSAARAEAAQEADRARRRGRAAHPRAA